MIGLRLQIPNGQRFFPLEVTIDRVGHCVGEFAPTRKRPVPPKASSKIRAKKGAVSKR